MTASVCDLALMVEEHKPAMTYEYAASGIWREVSGHEEETKGTEQNCYAVLM